MHVPKGEESRSRRSLSLWVKLSVSKLESSCLELEHTSCSGEVGDSPKRGEGSHRLFDTRLLVMLVREYGDHIISRR